jgi:hypothetical protein
MRWHYMSLTPTQYFLVSPVRYIILFCYFFISFFDVVVQCRNVQYLFLYYEITFIPVNLDRHMFRPTLACYMGTLIVIVLLLCISFTFTFHGIVTEVG